MKLRLLIELDYDADLMHGDDDEAKKWFFTEVLGVDPEDEEHGLLLYSGLVGGDIGRVSVIQTMGEVE
jgi:hypothetical protein